MEIDPTSPRFRAAMRDFRRARQRGALENIVAHLTGKSNKLLSYDQIGERLQSGEAIDRGLQQIPLDAIVGSVGRYADFTRTFLPRREGAQERWLRVRAAFDHPEQIPPILVYKVGDSYFVLDGNHRVSVARVLGASHILAYVTEVKTNIPLTPDTSPDELIIRAKHADFLAETGLGATRPEADLGVTVPGQYRVLKAQIRQHYRWLRQHRGDDVTFTTAAANWYDEIYLPVVRAIRWQGILRHFPGRTETDLYVWTVRHREEVEAALGWEVDVASAAGDLAHRHSSEPQQILARVKERIVAAITPDPLEAGPPPGQWRELTMTAGARDKLFANILVPVDGEEDGWRALGQALVVARREDARLNGLHVLRSGGEGVRARGFAVQKWFEARVREAGVRGTLSLDTGRVARIICDRAYWNDLVVMTVSHPPGPQPGDRFGSGVGTLIRRCGRPVLAVPGASTLLLRPLLSYDGSPKAKEALFVAAYVAGKWQVPLVVVTVEEDERAAATMLAPVQAYLQARDVDATCVKAQGDVVAAIARTAEAHDNDFIIMGGYGFRPLLEVVLGSTVDQVLRWRRWPVLICR